MTGALVRGYLADPRERPLPAVADPSPAARAAFEEVLPADRIFASVPDMLDRLQGPVVLAVKPQQAPEVLEVLSGRPLPLLLSIAAGLTTTGIQSRLGSRVPVIRSMPNTPALVGRGITALAAGSLADSSAMAWARELMESVGEVVELPESQLDAVTALSGSGPAYFFLFMDALVRAGVELGLERTLALRLVLATAEGAAALSRSQDGAFRDMIAAVASKGGTTERALAVLAERGLEEAVFAAAHAARDRARELASA